MNEVSKFRCMVYGCTVPAGIFHEHPTDAPVIRDPAGPLDAFERAELEEHRRAAAFRADFEKQKLKRQAFLQGQSMQNAWGFGSIGQQYHHGTAADQAHAMDQLMRHHRDEALLHVAAMTPPPPIIIQNRKLTQALLDAGRIRRENADLGVVFNEAPAPRRSFVSLTARVAFWIVLAVTVCIWIFAGVKS